MRVRIERISDPTSAGWSETIDADDVPREGDWLVVRLIGPDGAVVGQEGGRVHKVLWLANIRAAGASEMDETVVVRYR